MFTKPELETLSLEQLRELAIMYGVQPTGNPDFRANWISSLIRIPFTAVKQVEQGRGLIAPPLASFQALGKILNEFGEPTDEQVSLIRMTLDGRWMPYPERYDQVKLLHLYKAKALLASVIDLLGQ